MRRSLPAAVIVFLLFGGIPAVSAGPNQPTVVVPANSQIELEGESGLFAHGWHDGAHGSDVRNINVPECGQGFIEVVTIVNTSATDVLTKYYWNPRRAWTPRGTSTKLVATAGCKAT